MPKNTGLGPVGTLPTTVSPDTLMCMVLPLLIGDAGLVDNTIAWAKFPGSPPGLGMGIMNCRSVSLHPVATSTESMVARVSHSFLGDGIIKTPPVITG